MSIQKEILTFIKHQSGARRADLTEQFSDMNTRQLSNALYRLVDQGYLTRTDDGVYFTTNKALPGVSEETAGDDEFAEMVEGLPEKVTLDDVGDEDHHVSHTTDENELPLMVDLHEAKAQALEQLLAKRDEQIKSLEAQVAQMFAAAHNALSQPKSPHECIDALMDDLPHDTTITFRKGYVPYINVEEILIELPEDNWEDVLNAITTLVPNLMDEVA